MTQAAVQCPRCGYDQSGAVAAWATIEPPACPLDGVCSECGLGFAWVDVLRPDLRRLRGFYEHAAGITQEAVWSLRTLWWALLPWRFWRRVKLEHAPVPRRMVMWPFLVAILLWMAGSLVDNAAYVIWKRMGPPPGRTTVLAWPPYGTAGGPLDPTEIASGWLRPIVAEMPWGTWTFDPLQWAIGSVTLLAAAAAWPLVLTLLARSRREAKVRRSHVMRAAVYSLAFVHLSLLLRLADAIWTLSDIAIRVAGGAGARASTWNAPLSGLLWSVAPLGRMLLLAWLLLWWYWALRRGFRLERARTIWALLACISVLVAVLTEISLMPWYLWWILG